MADFNLQTLYHFRPARLLCQKCLALLIAAPSAKGQQNPKCPVCLVEYVPAGEFGRYSVREYLFSQGCAVKFEDLLQHCLDLAEATQPSDLLGSKPPLRMLLDAISHAKHFVHFTSFGISDFFMGVLKLTAQRVPVRGIVSNIDERTVDEFTLFKEDVPPSKLEIKHYLRGEAWEEAPHQKLIVIDGLIAFKGSANFTVSGWRKAAKGRDHVEAVTSVGEVIDLHNKLFSPVWASRSKEGASIKMEESPF